MIKDDAKKISLREQSAWLLVAKLIGFAFSFMLPLFIVRFLTQEQVGHYRGAFQVITHAVVLLPLGFSMSAYYFLAREKERRGAAILNILIFNFVVGGSACLLLYLYPQLIGNIFRSEELTLLAPMIGIVIWIWIFATFLEMVAIANQEAKVATAFIISSQVSKTVLMGGAVIVFGTVESFLYAAIIQGVIQTFLLFNYLRSRFADFWRQFDPAFFREQMMYAIPFGLAGILYMAQYDIHLYFAGYQFTSAEFAIYAYGCFEVPLIAMLSESVTAVLIPRMSELQRSGDKDEMIRLTARAMQKLAFFYFPIYVFLMITAHTFITTLFTQNFAASASVFVINLTLLPFAILITDPIVRSFKELGRLFLITRVIVLSILFAVLYFNIDSLGMTGIIAVAVGAILLEKLIAETMIVRKLGLGLRHLSLLTVVGKTAVVSLIAGAVTYVVYWSAKDRLLSFGETFASDVFATTNAAALNFFGGSLVLLISGTVFAVVYLLAANFWGIIENEEKESAKRFIRKYFKGRGDQRTAYNES